MELREQNEIKLRKLDQDGDAFRMKVPVLQADVENANKRRYPFAVVKKAVEELKAKLQKRSAFGSTRHEKDLEVDQVSHYVEDIELDKEGTAFATLKILPTQRGRNLAAIIRGGGGVGVSARGTGDIKDGIVQAGYKLLGVDFTLDPSFNFRVGKECLMFESRTEEETDGEVTLEELKKMGLIDEGGKELTEDVLKAKYRFAIEAGFKGDFEQYKSILEKGK